MSLFYPSGGDSSGGIAGLSSAPNVIGNTNYAGSLAGLFGGLGSGGYLGQLTGSPTLGMVAPAILGMLTGTPLGMVNTTAGAFNSMANSIYGQALGAFLSDPANQGVMGPPTQEQLNAYIPGAMNLFGLPGVGPYGGGAFGAGGYTLTNQGTYGPSGKVTGQPFGQDFAISTNASPTGPPGAPPGVPSDEGNPSGNPNGAAGPVGVGGGGGGGGGSTFICSALHRRGLLDDETLMANKTFAKYHMTRAEYRGYKRWAAPLVLWADRHPIGAFVLLKAFGWMPRAYMAEIRQPGSSRVGRVILRGGLRICAWLGA